MILAVFVPTLARAEPASDPQTPPPGDPPIDADPAASEAAPSETIEPAPAPAIADAAWQAMRERDVVIETASGSTSGRLVSVDGEFAVVVEPDGRVTSVAKADATALRIAEPTTPSPAATPAPEPVASPYEPPPPTKPEREFSRLGLFMAHGVAGAFWRASGESEAAVTYAGDLGIGGNVSKSFGVYAMGGGYFGANLFKKTVDGNLGRIAAIVAFRGRFFMGTMGLGAAFSRLATEIPGASGPVKTVFRDAGLAIPIKLMGVIPLPKHLYLGIGLGYDPAFLRGFKIIFNGIGLQLSLGYW